jgi:hypothetical protein
MSVGGRTEGRTGWFDVTDRGKPDFKLTSRQHEGHLGEIVRYEDELCARSEPVPRAKDTSGNKTSREIQE